MQPLRHLSRARPTTHTHTHTHTRTTPQTRPLSLPTILRPTFWSTLLPKSLRPHSPSSSSSTHTTHTPRSNPATPYIILALLIGSQAIQTLWLKQDRAHRLRRAEAKMGVLREVIERVKRGEEVDVEGVLGVGDGEEEGGWADVLKELREEEALFQSGKVRREGRRMGGEEERGGDEKGMLEEEQKHGQEEEEEEAKVKVERLGDVKFY